MVALTLPGGTHPGMPVGLPTIVGLLAVVVAEVVDSSSVVQSHAGSSGIEGGGLGDRLPLNHNASSVVNTVTKAQNNISRPAIRRIARFRFRATRLAAAHSSRPG